jgi:hypothetical protein
MPTLPWTSEDQALFLLSRFPDWEVAVATKRRGKKNPDKAAFINETLELWDKHWPLYWMNLPEEQLTSKRTGRVSTRDEYSRRVRIMLRLIVYRPGILTVNSACLSMVR